MPYRCPDRVSAAVLMVRLSPGPGGARRARPAAGSKCRRLPKLPCLVLGGVLQLLPAVEPGQAEHAYPAAACTITSGSKVRVPHVCSRTDGCAACNACLKPAGPTNPPHHCDRNFPGASSFFFSPSVARAGFLAAAASRPAHPAALPRLQRRADPTDHARVC